MDVHFPYIPPPPFDRMYMRKGMEFPDREKLLKMNRKYRAARSQPDRVTLELMRDLYTGGITYEDSLIGDFLDFLDELNLLDSTLIIFTSDHGEEFMEHGGTTHAKTLYDEVVKVPLIVRYPPIFPQGLIVEEPVQLLDISPTILDIYGIEPPPTFEGISLLEIIDRQIHRRDLQPVRPMLSELHFREKLVQSVQEGDWKLILRNTIRGDSTRSDVELYYLRNDPWEKVDLSDDQVIIVERLSSYLLDLPKGEGAKVQVPKKLRKRLEALGYMPR